MSDDKDQAEHDDTMPRVVADAVAALAPAPDATEHDIARVMRAVRARGAEPRSDSHALTHAAGQTGARAGNAWRRRLAVAGFAIAASWLGIVVLGDRGAQPHDQPGVRFEIVAPDVQSVSLVGDFNGWNARATPMTRDPQTGAWAASVALTEGRYLYAFVADGARWMSDPNAPLAAADDFARQNSVVLVSANNSIDPQ